MIIEVSRDRSARDDAVAEQAEETLLASSGMRATTGTRREVLCLPRVLKQ